MEDNHEFSRPQDWREEKAFFPIRSCNNLSVAGTRGVWCELMKCQKKVSAEMAGPVAHKQVLVAASLACVRMNACRHVVRVKLKHSGYVVSVHHWVTSAKRAYAIRIDVNSFEAEDACVCLFNDAVHSVTKSV
jgi:hypothetical protein